MVEWGEFFGWSEMFIYAYDFLVCAFLRSGLLIRL